MKTEKLTRQIFSPAPNSYLQEIADGQEHENQTAGRAKCSSAAGSCVEFSIDEVDNPVPERFEKTVRKYSDRLAIKLGERSLTYNELNRAANRIARSILERRGPGSEPIALLFKDGIEVIVAIFGVLKAGKFYVALNPSIPTERNIYMLDDSGAKLILTHNQNIELARKLANDSRSVLYADEIDNEIPSENLALSISPDDLATIMYTSGSTGQPKGAARTHRNTGESHSETPVFPDDRLTLLHSLSFGSASDHLYAALLNGASLFPFDIKSQGVQRLANWLREEKITLCHLPPAVFRQLSDILSGQEKLLNLRLIRLSGAPITRHDFDLYKNNFSSSTLLKIGMGSTEAGRICSAVLDQTFDFPNEGTAAGYPRKDKQILLLDENGHEVGPHEVGEIAVKGRGLANGYWNRPEITSAKFMSNPNRAEERIYLTGDLGRILPDGFLVHLGRKDFMVKIRGYRVELGEIERALREYPQIREAGVVAWDQESGEKNLVAYVVPRQGFTPTVVELRRFLSGTLPDYMIPSNFIFLDSLPLTNGKLDRTALPKPGNERPELTRPFTSPRNKVEQMLAGIWAQVLGVDQVGIHDDFFELGGHSLLASQLFIEIEKAFGKQLPLTTLFWARNVEQLARIIQHEEWSAPWSLMFPIQTSGSRPPLFWVYGETSDVLLPRYLGPDQPLYGLMHETRTGKRVLYRTIPDIAANHLKEIQKVQPQGPYYLGGFCFGGMVAFEIAQQLKKQGKEVGLLFLIDLATLVNWRSRFESTESFRSEISRHSRSLAKIGVREKFNYVRLRVRDRINGILIRGKNIALTVARNAYFATGHLLPPSLRPHYLSSVDHWAMRQYVPHMYAGDLILFKSEQRTYDPAWIAKFVTGKLHLRELPSGHQDLLKEPDIVLWAHELRACLEKAQTARQGFNPSRSTSGVEPATRLK